MAKVITQEAVDKAVTKAVVAEQKRIIAVIKATEVDAATKPKAVKAALVAAIKADNEPS